MSAVTDDQTFNDPHEATDALVEAFGELRGAAGLSEQSSEPDMVAEHALTHPLLRGQNSVQRRIEQTEPVVGRPGQRLDGVLGVRHQPDHAAVG
jgi:hypothetical protein